jgi:hypothetical protein
MLRVTSKHLTVLRVGLSLGGFAAALLAVSLDDRRFTWAAIALLAASLIIRLVQRRPKSD